MIIDNPPSDYMRAFEKKFSSFCERAPIYVSFSTEGNFVHLELQPSDTRLSIQIEEHIPIFENIRKIFVILREKVYPKMKKVVSQFVEPSAQELRHKVEQEGWALSEAYQSLSHREVSEIYVVTKIDLRKNTLLIEQDNKKFVYKLPVVPVVSFIKMLSADTESNWELLQQNGTLLYEVKPKGENRD